MYKKTIITLLLFVLFFFNHDIILAQVKTKDPQLGTWNTLNFQYTFAPKWGTMIELQTRLNQPFHQLNYYEQKIGLYYNINKDYQVLLGLGHYGTHDINHFSDGPITREARLWQQFTINQYLTRLKFEHRFRIEERWLNRNFANRFRYRIQLAIPLNHDKIEAKTVFVTAFNELFLTTKMPHFLRNRAYIGMGYQFNKIAGIQVGLIHQYNYNLEKAGSKKYLFLNLNIKLEERAQHKSQIPRVD